VGELWSVLVPVKGLARAKTRLSPLGGALRSELALAFARDTVTAAAACPRVGEVLAVTGDPRAQRALAELGASVVGGEPGTGLNPALEYGAAAARLRSPGQGVCALSADLPALRPEELERALDDAARYPRSFVADTAGVGTTLYAAAPGAEFAPAFEGPSRRRHLRLGAVELSRADLPGLRRDADTPADLDAARGLGVGRYTAAALERLGL